MRQMKLHLLTLILFVLSSGVNTNINAQGKFEKSGSAGGQFLKIGIGARAIGMGGSFVAVANDISALYWNPAGITRLENSTLIISHNKWIADTNFEFIGFATTINRNSAIGFYFSYLNFGEIEQTTVRNPRGTGVTFSAYDYAIAGTFSHTLIEDFSVGVTLKYIRETIWNLNASTMAFDVGALFNPGIKPITFGVSLSNFSPDLSYSGSNLYTESEYYDNSDPVDVELRTTPYPLPLIFRFGVAFELPQSEERSLVVSLEADHLTDSEQKLNFGAEYNFIKGMDWRSGYRFNDDEGEYSVGFGLRYPLSDSVEGIFDYAYQSMGRLLNSHRISIRVNF